MNKKKCTKCKKYYPATLEYFTKSFSGKKDGLSSWCRFCHRKLHNEYMKEYRKTLGGKVARLMERIRYRCNKPKSPLYKYYGAKGIEVCFTRIELLNWIKQNRININKKDIHRIDNAKNYTLDNIVFLSRKQHTTLHWKTDKR